MREQGRTEEKRGTNTHMAMTTQYSDRKTLHRGDEVKDLVKGEEEKMATLVWQLLKRWGCRQRRW